MSNTIVLNEFWCCELKKDYHFHHRDWATYDYVEIEAVRFGADRPTKIKIKLEDLVKILDIAKKQAKRKLDEAQLVYAKF